MMMRFTSYVARIPVDRPDDEEEQKYIKELAGIYTLKGSSIFYPKENTTRKDIYLCAR